VLRGVAERVGNPWWELREVFDRGVTIRRGWIDRASVVVGAGVLHLICGQLVEPSFQSREQDESRTKMPVVPAFPRKQDGPAGMTYEPMSDEWKEWLELTRIERFRESEKLFAQYLAMGGSVDPDPDPTSPVYDPSE
jgi:hypothetical protein